MEGLLPSRIIRESCTTSPTLDALSDGAERMFWRLTTIADDFGRFDADHRVLLARCFPLKTNTLSLKEIEKYITEMVSVSLITLYEVNNRIYGYFNTWGKYQRIRCKVSKFPEPLDKSHVVNNSFFYQRAIPVEIRNKIKERDKVCLCCGSSDDLEYDHIIPVQKGGKADLSNLQLLCHECNAAKYTKELNFLKRTDEAQQFAAERRKLQQNAPVVMGYGIEGIGYITEDMESKTKKTFSSDSVEVGLSELLFSLIKEKNPGHRQPDIQKWAKHVDLMLRIDKRDAGEIKEIIIACQKHSFWHKNILSTEKLREQYDKLKIDLKIGVNMKNMPQKQEEYVYEKII